MLELGSETTFYHTLHECHWQLVEGFDCVGNWICCVAFLHSDGVTIGLNAQATYYTFVENDNKSSHLPSYYVCMYLGMDVLSHWQYIDS